MTKPSVPSENQEQEITDTQADQDYDKSFDELDKPPAEKQDGVPKAAPARETKSPAENKPPEDEGGEKPAEEAGKDGEGEEKVDGEQKDKGEEQPQADKDKPAEGAESDLDKAKKIAAELAKPPEEKPASKTVEQMSEEEQLQWAEQLLKKKGKAAAAGEAPKEPAKPLAIADVVNAIPEAERKEAQEFVEDYPAAAKILVAGINLARAQASGAAPDSNKTIDELRTRAQKMEEYIDARTFLEDVEETHPDARKVIRSKEYEQFLKTHADLAPLYDSPDPAHAVALLSAFKEFKILSAKQQKDEAARKKLKEKDDLAAESLEGKVVGAGGSGTRRPQDADSEYEAEFGKLTKGQEAA